MVHDSHNLSAAAPTSSIPWYKQSHLLKLNYTIISMVLLASANGYDGSVMGGLLAFGTWNKFMNYPQGAYLGWISSIYWLGNGVSFPMAAWVSERFGRKRGIYVGFVLLALGIGLQAGAQTEKMFTVSRLIVGFASAWLGNGPPLLINEVAYPTHRAVLSSAFMCGWYVGGTICGWATFACRVIPSEWSWRIPVLLQCVLPLIALPGTIMAPESPRWLVSKGRISEATQIIADNHNGGDLEDPLVAFQMAEIEMAITLEREASASASYADMVKTHGNRRRMIISISLGIFSQWCGNGVVSYYLPLVLSSVGLKTVTQQTLISACLNVWNLFWAVAAALNVDRLGRRPLFLASGIIMLISYIIITGLSGSFATTGSSSVGLAVVPFLFVFYAGYDLALTPLLTAYPCEVWQFSLRSRGLTLTWCTGVVAIFFNTFINAIALEAIGWKYYIVFIVIIVLYILTAFFAYPETRGRTLEQITTIFDEAEAQAMFDATSKVSKQARVEIEDQKMQA
ncbi:sugar transporter [Dactylonectria estremocensis]|uniref:Sugar transporter n=1 Tax=Dactylonectria estremocensis TaxID=1079267 RepID=A0A9P9EMW4_9HYPO|nr:sugar transporter [Dactylonectria estremocensis]